MKTLENEGIETFKKCDDDEECKRVLFLDGGSVSFKTRTNLLQINYDFAGILPLTTANLEKTALRRQGQKLVSVIHEQIDFKKQFKQSVRRLPRGYYFYHDNGNYFAQSYKR